MARGPEDGGPVGAARPLPPGLRVQSWPMRVFVHRLTGTCPSCSRGGAISTQTSVRLGCAVRPGEPERESPGDSFFGHGQVEWAGDLGKCVCV